MTSTVAKGTKLAGKVAIVTASTDGIGLAIAKRLGQDGAKVMISSRKKEHVEGTVENLRKQNLDVAGTICHVGKSKDRESLVQETLKTFGGIDILVSNAAANPVFGPILDTSEEAWDKIFDVNIKSAFLLCKEVVPHMEARGSGAIVFVSSFVGYAPSELMGPYSVSKTALIGLTKAMSPQLAGMNIRVNCLAPGLIKTKFSEMLWKNPNTGFQQDFLNSIAMKRFGEPEECSGTVSFLVSDDASYITGETILVTGGIPARL
ncbi:hypothetical protein ScPMuIL_000125 [Solemya velum]